MNNQTGMLARAVQETAIKPNLVGMKIIQSKVRPKLAREFGTILIRMTTTVVSQALEVRGKIAMTMMEIVTIIPKHLHVTQEAQSRVHDLKAIRQTQ
jgi:hypothetical protein